MKCLLLLLMFQAQVQPNLPQQNQRHLERLEDRIYAMERQLDRVENTVDEAKDSMDKLADRIGEGSDSTEILLYVLMVALGIDKGSYWIRRRNGRNGFNSKGGKET